MYVYVYIYAYVLCWSKLGVIFDFFFSHTIFVMTHGNKTWLYLGNQDLGGGEGLEHQGCRDGNS